MTVKELNLRYFHSVAKTGSLSSAAEDLHVAVSAVSRQITNLESRLDVKLFHRRPRGMELTEAGELLLAYALRNQLEVSNLIDEIQGLTKKNKKKIKLACPEGMAWHFLPSAIAGFSYDNPGVSFDLQVVDSSQASELVKEGKVDIALTFSLSVSVGVKVVSSHNAAIWALMSKDHPLSCMDTLSVSELADYPLAMSLGGTTMRYLFDASCSLSGLDISPRFSCDSLSAIYTMVNELPNMVALCGAIAVMGKSEKDGLVLRPMREPQFSQRSLQIQVMSDRKFPSDIERFLGFLCERLDASCI
ncbi:LysR family transcriptional regulator [Halomonas sp. H5]|uniref:LysR family transcriptional regulator n=1 Tax=Halomonas sp. H5 TaxID=3423910 RepID=UPI003D35E313